MTNPIFRRGVDSLFDKLAWPYDPEDVARRAPDVARQIRSGRRLFAEGVHAARSVPDVARAGGRVVEKVLRPAPGFVAAPFLRMARGAKDFAKVNPNAARTAVGLTLLAPILHSSFRTVHQRNEEELLNLRQDPGRDITASLDAFLEKKAAISSIFPRLPAIGTSVRSNLTKGIGSGIAQGTIGLVADALKGGVGALRDLFLNERRRKQLFTALLENDVVLADGLRRNPATIDLLKEAYGTMCRFAPSLALDPNAVRSFLREVVVGGSGGVNYLTIKHLIETERALHTGSPRS